MLPYHQFRTSCQTPPSSTPFVPPSRSDWDLLFQPMFDESLIPRPYVDLQAPEVIAHIPEAVAHATCIRRNSENQGSVGRSWLSPRKKGIPDFEESFPFTPCCRLEASNFSSVICGSRQILTSYKLKKALLWVEASSTLHGYDMLSSFLIANDFSIRLRHSKYTADAPIDSICKNYGPLLYVHKPICQTFKLNNKKHILDLDQFRRISSEFALKSGNKKFEEPPLEKDGFRISSLSGYSSTNVSVGKIPPKTKGSKKKADTDTTTKMKPPTVPKEKKEKKSKKGEAEGYTIVGDYLKAKLVYTPGVPDAPDYDSDDDISWKSSDDDQDDEKAQDDEDEAKNDDNETTQDDEDDDVH
ncbi:hypothetical protein Tco_0598258 [Tanacetum coccineum]